MKRLEILEGLLDCILIGSVLRSDPLNLGGVVLDEVTEEWSIALEFKE